MKELNNISNVYFLGIGGIGMSAIARYFNQKGVKVSGYDRTETPLTSQLQHEGINIHFTDDISLADTNAQLVIYTPAIPVSHSELQFFRTNNFRMMKRSEVLGLITQEFKSICVAGTHGKTTTSAMIAHVLHESTGCTAFLGGIAANYDTNYWNNGTEYCVAEADEYDRSFLQLHPDIAVITSMDPDHLDIYGDEKSMQDAFIGFSNNINESGLLIRKHDIARADDFAKRRSVTYSVSNENADVFATDITINSGAYYFNYVWKQRVTIQDIELHMGGVHNIENAVAAITVAIEAGVPEKKIKNAIAGFRGVKRRFEYIIKSNDIIMIDDYAHHPEELRALILSAQKLYPEYVSTIVFQPHLYSRTRDLAEGFAEVLNMCDEVILLPIYPARELPVEGVTSSLIAEKMNTRNVQIVEKSGLPEKMKSFNKGLLIIAGAGDIDTMVEPIKNILSAR